MEIVLQNADITKAKSHRKKAPLELKEGRCQFLFVLIICQYFAQCSPLSISMLACSDNHKEIIAWNLPRSRRYPYDVPEQQKKTFHFFLCLSSNTNSVL